MIDKHTEEYIQPFDKFSGHGQSLGSTIHRPVEIVDTPKDWELKINDSEPKTKIQFRLMNGKRITQEFNLTHTIGDIQSFVLTYLFFLSNLFNLYNQTPNESFILMAGYPPKQLVSLDLTIKEADLTDSAITQRKC